MSAMGLAENGTNQPITNGADFLKDTGRLFLVSDTVKA